MFPGVELNWLASHQKCVQFEQNLNAEADRVAEIQHECSREWANANKRYLLPNKWVQLYLDGTCVNIILKKKLCGTGLANKLRGTSHKSFNFDQRNFLRLTGRS